MLVKRTTDCAWVRFFILQMYTLYPKVFRGNKHNVYLPIQFRVFHLKDKSSEKYFSLILIAHEKLLVLKWYCLSFFMERIISIK